MNMITIHLSFHELPPSGHDAVKLSNETVPKLYVLRVGLWHWRLCKSDAREQSWRLESPLNFCSDILSRQFSAASDGLDYLFHCKSVLQGRGHCPDPYEHSTWTPMLRFHHTRKLNQQSFCMKWLCLVTHWWRLRMLQLLQSEKTTSTLCRLKLLKSFPFSHFTHNIVDALTQEHVGDTTVGKSYPG